ncbi:MAG: glycosyl transferase [Legionellales bacterium RIFCSPHIGHO2_12_FULL_35_11]|nr:MAG: glycosyl transferase [Legionellales bacterium RIFCSPHIGHO2_12_FULL_35_11]
MKVSIVTPSFNQGEFIERTLESVASQREFLPEGIELTHVVYDGGSADNTLDILKKHSNQITWFSEADNGQAHAVNKGLMHTDGDIIGWLNSDDIYYPQAVKKVVDFFQKNPEIDVVYGKAFHIDLFDKPYEEYPTANWDAKLIKEECFICQPALFFRRKILKVTGLLDESLDYCMDYEFWVRLSCMGIKFAYLEEELAGSRMYPENKTLSSKIPVHKEINDMLRKHLGAVPMRAILNYAYAVVNEEINNGEEPIKFAKKLLQVSVQSAKNWNGGIFIFLSCAILHWSRGFMQGRHRLWRKA